MISDRIQERTIDEITNAFHSIGYKSAFVKRNYGFSDFLALEPTLRTISLAVFGQEPMDYRSACFGLEFASETPIETVADQLRALGAPQIFLVQNGNTQWWANKEKGAVFRENIKTREISKLIDKNSEDWKPEKMMRIKSGFMAPLPQQLDFIDIGLLPTLEHQASLKIDSLIRRVLYNAEKELEEGKNFFDAPLIFNIVFRLLTAKLLKDKDISIIPEIDFSHPWNALKTVEGHYGEEELGKYQDLNLPEAVIMDIASEIDRFFSLKNISVDTLAYVYENTFVSQKSRKKLGIHSTPSYIADYVLSQMPIEDLPRSKWHVLDPMCGHGIFLIAAMRKMRNLLPSDWRGKRRHSFFSKMLHGIEIDPFSTEVARLCLTLSDFPESDGWDLRVEDTFNGESLDGLLSKSNIFVGNPPFETIENFYPEISKPKEILRRILPKLQEGSLIGFVLPLSFLDGNDYRAERKMVQDAFDVINITTLPDRIFKYSDAETAILIARKRSVLKMLKTVFRIVSDDDKNRFRVHSTPTFEDIVPSNYFTERMQGRFMLPLFREIWERLEENANLKDIADIKTGVEYEPGLKPDQLMRKKPFPGSALGLFKITEGFNQFVIDDNVYLSTKKEHRRKMVGGAWNLNWQKPKVVIPKSRMSRGPWRFAAAIDREGLLIRRRFFAVWPKKSDLSIEFLAALFNSPLAQAFVSSHSKGRDIPKRVYDSIPIPLEYKSSIRNINVLVKEYEKAHKQKNESANKVMQEIDFTILELYNLPRRLIKIILHFFEGYQRPAPFDFQGYDLNNIPISKLKSISPEINLAPEVTDFCDKKGISRYLKTAIDIIRRSFLSIKEMEFIIEQDPEIDNEWLLIDIIVDGTAEELLTAYDKYIEQWVSTAPESARENIKLSYGVF